ncbi:hypothetical protein C8R47DRAFT_975549 [Mycena vitilis]|nr:hypothetical protein C8R47DRAFT_975549 [Mycena vitilis]
MHHVCFVSSFHLCLHPADRHPRPPQQVIIHRLRQPDPVLRRHHLRELGLGALLLDYKAGASCVFFSLACYPTPLRSYPPARSFLLHPEPASPLVASILLSSCRFHLAFAFTHWPQLKRSLRSPPTETQSHALTHLLFALTVGLCAYNFFRAVTLDAGTCPKPGSDAELKSIIEDLASEGRLNGQTFCVQLGANNHRQFVIFVSTLVLGVGLFDYLTYASNTNTHLTVFSSLTLPVPGEPNSPDAPVPSGSCPLPASLCALTAQDAFLVSVAAWATLQLSWTSVLLASQLWQIARQMTTLEVSNLGRYGFMGGRGGVSLGGAGQMGHRHTHGSSANSSANSGASSDGADADPDAAAPTAPHTHSSSGFLMNLLGLDRFTRGKAGAGLARAGKASNPFDLGAVRNCRDFWTKGRELVSAFRLPFSFFLVRKEGR